MVGGCSSGVGLSPLVLVNRKFDAFNFVGTVWEQHLPIPS